MISFCVLYIGHVDAGKSTLMGHLLYQLGNVNQRAMHKYEQESKKLGKSSFAYAWVLDETEEERLVVWLTFTYYIEVIKFTKGFINMFSSVCQDGICWQIHNYFVCA